MSQRDISAQNRQCTHSFILTCFKAAISKHALHDRWLPADQLRLYMLQKYSIEDAAQFNLASMIRVVNKGVLPLMRSAPNILEIQGGQQVQVYRHSFQNRKHRYFFFVTTKLKFFPALPSQLKASSWEQDCVLTRLLAGSQSKPLSTKISEQEIIVMDDAINNGNGDGLERPKKRKRGGSNESEPIIISPAEHHQMKTDADVWWHSGDARKLFAPTNVYGNGADVRKIVLERIGIMEDVNNHWDN